MEAHPLKGGKGGWRPALHPPEKHDLKFFNEMARRKRAISLKIKSPAGEAGEKGGGNLLF
jgi:hypothetical protein